MLPLQSFNQQELLKIKAKNLLKFIWNEFIYGGHLQCLGFVGLAFISGYLLALSLDWRFFVIVYLIFYPIYLYDRLKGIHIDEISNPERTAHFKKYLNKMYLLFCSAVLFLILFLIFLKNLLFSIYTLTLLSLGLLYAPVFKKLTQKIVGFKNFYVSAFFSVITFAPVLYLYSWDSTKSVTLLFLAIFVYLNALKMQIFLDIKDIEVDKKSRLLTIPAILGREKTSVLLKLIIMISLIALLSSVFFHIFPWPMLILLLVYPYNFYCLKLAERGNYKAYILESGEFFLWAFLILAINLILWG
jgi:4-hydroxybenzoate polyprenyltransferase